MKSELTTAFMNYYKENKRDLPWRHTKDAYKIWISEIMLQQTRVEAVKEYYERFIKTLPTIYDLAEVDTDTLMKLWQGLGYYSRAMNLKKCAIECVKNHEGKLPDTYESLVKLPGIGKYTAGAISSLAYGKCKSAVDGNVMRVFSRLFDIHDNVLKEKTKDEFIRLVDTFVDEEHPGDFNQAIMDFGNDICIANGVPHCERCPLQSFCKAFENNTVMELPNRERNKSKKEEQHTIIILRYNNEIYLEKRPNEGLLAGLYEFINLLGEIDEDKIALMFSGIQQIRYTGEVKNVFSHRIWHMKIYEVYVNQKPESAGIWVDEETLHTSISLPTVMQKAWDTI